MTTLDAQVLAYASLSLWCNLLYFARIWESTGMYIVLFRQFTTQMINFIFLIIVFMLISADYFSIVWSTNTLIDPETKKYIETPIASLYEGMKFSIFWGILAADDVSSVSTSDSKIFLIIVWCILSIIIPVIILNLMVAVITWLFEDILNQYVQSN